MKNFLNKIFLNHDIISPPSIIHSNISFSNHPEQYGGRLTAYKQALHNRTQIPEDQIVASVFNEYQYYEFE
ncbi:MAG: hypothetical protein QCI00_09985 [Candidatus Thermoplasmatota archaeon]|nr:hypothetical protein [Candidatus Thermoplasmatota archaeon]